MFAPNVNDILEIGRRKYRVPQARAGVDMPLEIEGGKAKVVRLERTDDKSLWALKVFKFKYRHAHQQEACKRLEPIRALPGLRAAEQIIISPNDALVQREPDLAWAVLMPWAQGEQWGKVLSMVQDGQRKYTREQAHALACGILDVFVALEREKIVHCDISMGNVLMETLGGGSKAYGAQLVDLEDMFIRGQMPASTTPGSVGYALPNVTKTACLEGDRYAGAILIAEALALGLEHAPDLASGEGVFRGNRSNTTAQARFDYLHGHLKKWEPKFAELLRLAWEARTLRDCAPLADLLTALNGTVPIPRTAATTTTNSVGGGRFGTGTLNVQGVAVVNDGTSPVLNPTPSIPTTPTSAGGSGKTIVNRFGQPLNLSGGGTATGGAPVSPVYSSSAPPPPTIHANPFLTTQPPVVAVTSPVVAAAPGGPATPTVAPAAPASSTPTPTAAATSTATKTNLVAEFFVWVIVGGGGLFVLWIFWLILKWFLNLFGAGL